MKNILTTTIIITIITGTILIFLSNYHIKEEVYSQIETLREDVREISVELRRTKKALALEENECVSWVNGDCTEHSYLVPAIQELRYKLTMLANELGYIYKEAETEIIPEKWEKVNKLSTKSLSYEIDADTEIYMEK